MDQTTVGYLACGLLLITLMLGVPVAVSMALAGIVGMWLGAGLTDRWVDQAPQSQASPAQLA